MSFLRTFEQIGPADADAVGGKALGLALLARAGFPVPAGFCVTTDAYRMFQGCPPPADSALAAQIADAYRRLGGGPVAVRSSATLEDSALASFAGQQETVLGVTGQAALLDAVGRCWASLHSERAVAYRRRQGVDEAGLALAVLVQVLIPSEISGVLFTRDPLDPSGRGLLIEAAWGLGEGVVSGRVAPDRWRLGCATGAVLEEAIDAKAVRWTATGPEPVPAALQRQPCLDAAQLAGLAELARRVEEFCGGPRDVEWAWAEGRLWLLQVRPITTPDAAERERVRREEIAALAARAAPEGTVWACYNLAEVLPAPTPMTWAVVQRLLSARGGFGLMYRDLGFDPDPALGEEGIFDLVCGRPYCNLSREPRMQFHRLPLGHPFAALKADPNKALYPQPQYDRARAGWRFWLTFPFVAGRLARSARRLRRLGRALPDRLRGEVFPAFARETAAEASRDFTVLPEVDLLERLEYWTVHTLHDFARDGLKPTALAALALGNVERLLCRQLGPQRTQAALRELAAGARPDPEADLGRAVRDLAAGRLRHDSFLERFGHRGGQEMELAQPRWAEEPAALDGLLRVGAGEGGAEASPSLPDICERVAAEARLAPRASGQLRGEVQALHAFLGLRETAKHYLMYGYALVRRILVELDRRHGMGGGIFFLTPDELSRLAAGHDLSGLIAGRRRRRQLMLGLEVPPVLFSDELEAIGRPLSPPSGEVLSGVPLSAGVAEGPALVLEDPADAEAPAGPYVLVCSSTDPAWVPLFVRACGLVMETGGILSHGAIVAREFGLPAVAGLPGVLRRVRTGQRLRVDGGTGKVIILDN